MKVGFLFAWLAAAAVLSVGCSGSGLPLVPVSGKVTFNGGPCPKAGTIAFIPASDAGVPGLPHRAGRATYDVDGKFTVTSFKEGDGLLPGRYRVDVECVNGIPSATTPWEQISFVPTDYKPPELVVEEGQSAIEVNYDVPPKKKK